MAELKCILDIMKDCITLEEYFSPNYDDIATQYHVQIDRDEIQNKKIREEMYEKIYNKIRNDEKYLVISEETSPNPWFYKKADIDRFMQLFIKSQKETIKISYINDSICDFINSHYSEIKAENWKIKNLKVQDERINKQVEKEEKALQLLNDIL